MKKVRQLLIVVNLFFSYEIFAQDTWRGLVVEQENRCSAYDKSKQYPYSQNVEDEIVRLMNGRVYGPYTGRYFESDRETDIEHIVAATEGHDSGLCSDTVEKRKEFASDPLNLTLAAPEVNRCGAGGKCGFDAGEWMPERNQCWFANRVVEIKIKYDLSVDRNEAYALERVLSECSDTEMIFYNVDTATDEEIMIGTEINALELYDDNGNGRITCAEARSHGIAPVRRGHIAYEFMSDGDGDGVVCE